jgi:hypothetical protein
VTLAPGDAVLAHPLLAHRGGRNFNAQGSRDIVFLRVRRRHHRYVDGDYYTSPERPTRCLNDPWCEYDEAFMRRPSVRAALAEVAETAAADDDDTTTTMAAAAAVEPATKKSKKEATDK